MMYGGSGYGEHAYSEHSYTPPDPSGFEEFLAEITSPRCWLVEIDAFSLASVGSRGAGYGDAGFGELAYGEGSASVAGGVETKRFSSHGYISKVEPSEHYLLLPGRSGNYASTPDSASNSITGDIDIRVELAMDDWTPSTVQNFICKFVTTGNQRSFRFAVSTNGRPQLVTSALGGGTLITTNATAAPAVSNGARLWLRVTLDVDDGAGNHVTKFYTSSDSVTWTQLGSTVTTAGARAIFNSNSPIEIGSHQNGTLNLLAGRVYYAEIRDGIDGAVVAKFDPSEAVEGTSSFTSGTGEVWTINRSGTPPASILDTAKPVYYDGRVQAKSIRVQRAIAGRDGIGGLALVRAEVQLDNSDGELDLLARDYALDGRQVRILFGRTTDERADFGVLFTGIVQSVEIGKAMTLRLSDGAARLNRLANPSTYAGTGDLEGGDDLQGKPRPDGWGAVFNIAPPLVDSSRLIYQVRDGAINDVTMVYDRQVELTQGSDYSSESDMLNNAPSAGNYRVWKAGGYFRLGSTPAGTVTCDAELDASGGGYVTATSDIVQRLLVNRAELYSTEINPASFVNLKTIADAPVGDWTGLVPTTCAVMIDRFLAGIGAYGGFNRQGAFTVGLVAAADGPAEATLDDTVIVSIEREPLPPAVEPVVWRTRVGWQKNHTVQSDVAAAVTAARRTFAAEPWRLAERKDETVQSRRLLARELVVDALYAEETDADEEADRLFDLWSTGRALYKVKAKLPALTRDLGSVVTLQHARFGLSGGRDGRVLGHTVLNGSDVELKVLV